MNSNRTKYASTPTYGMQKRNYAKKQAAAQASPTPDFTQQPAADSGIPLAPFPAQNPFLPPTGAFQDPMVPVAGAPFAAMPPMGGVPQMPTASQNLYPNQPMNGYPNFLQTGNVPVMPPYQQAMGGAMPQPNANFMPQGYAAPPYAQPGAMPPNVMRSEPVGAPGGMNSMPGMNGYGVSGGYGGYPGGGMNGMAQSPYANPGYPQGMMNANFNGNGYGRPPYPSMEGGSPAMPTPKPPMDPEQWLKVILYGILPVLFIPCVFVTHTFDFLRYLFIIMAVITLSIVWYRQSFTSGVRTTVSIAYLALSIITIAMLVNGNGNRDLTQTAGSLNNAAAQITLEPSASPQMAPAGAEETPAPEEDVGESEAEQRLATFMDYWSVNRIEDMVGLVQPSWASQQDNAAQSLFTVISNRTPQEYTIEGISGVSTDSSRTVTMSALIDKNNGKDPVRYRFMILMVKEGVDWYVDPNSLATNDTVEPTPTVTGKEVVVQSLAPRMTVTPIPDPSTKLYYNATGGKYYHIDPNCSAVNPKYLPMASFLYSELDDPPYNSLSPCLKCGAPTQSLGSLKTDATATPQP